MSNRSLSPFWTLFILTGLNLFNYLDRSVVPAVLTDMKSEFALSDGQVGRINTIFMLGYFLTSPVFGYLGDRVSRKWLIAAGIFVWSLGTVLTGFAPSFLVLLACRVLVGVGEASYATISPSLISDTYAPARRNNALTIFYVAIPVGSALGYIIGSMMAIQWGWRWAFVWAGLPGLLLATVLLPFREPARGAVEGGSSTAKPRLGDGLRLFRIPDFSLVVWGYTAYTFALGAFAVWGPSFLERVHNVPKQTASTFFGAVLVVTGLVGTMAGGFAATAWQRRNPAGYAWMLGLSAALSAPLGVAAFLTENKTASMSCLAAAMFFIFLCTGPVNTLILESVPLNLRASAMAMSIFCIHLFGDLWSSEIVGHLSDHWGNLRHAVLILPGALGVAALLWFMLAMKQRRRPRSAHLPHGNEAAR
jgi:MFS transporter, Spinster family, sphingosine-1-phosphate transporter